MSCHGCAENFGLLKKEYGCPKCKFSYCKKCLRFQITDVSTSKQLMVCLNCHQLSQKAGSERIEVMRALHRLESLDDPAKPPITVYRQPVTRVGKLEELKRGLSPEDQEILARLESLKKDDEARRSSGKRRTSEKVEEEIAERLARLKGEEYNPDANTSAVNFRNIKPETEADLIAKYTTEVALDSKYEKGVVSDIEARLARLRGDPQVGGATASRGPADSQTQLTRGDSSLQPEDFELTESEQVERIMRQLKEELSIEEKFGKPPSVGVQETETEPSQSSSDHHMLGSDDDDDIDVDELCGICSDKKAILICKECDDDIFCRACFQELHRDLGEMHAAKPFKLRKQ